MDIVANVKKCMVPRVALVNVINNYPMDLVILTLLFFTIHSSNDTSKTRNLDISLND